MLSLQVSRIAKLALGLKSALTGVSPNDGKNVMFFVIQTCHSRFRVCGMSAILMADEASSASSDKYESS